MLGELITSKTRLRLLIKFFVSQANRGYLNGLATEMGLAGFTDEQIMAAGRWSSTAFRSYCKLPRSKRLNEQHRLIKKITGK